NCRIGIRHYPLDNFVHRTRFSALLYRRMLGRMLGDGSVASARPGDVGGHIAAHRGAGGGEAPLIWRNLLLDADFDAARSWLKRGIVANQRDRSWPSGLRHRPIVIWNRRR